jgi:hypothetical protein
MARTWKTTIVATKERREQQLGRGLAKSRKRWVIAKSGSEPVSRGEAKEAVAKALAELTPGQRLSLAQQLVEERETGSLRKDERDSRTRVQGLLGRDLGGGVAAVEVDLGDGRTRRLEGHESSAELTKGESRRVSYDDVFTAPPTSFSS